MWNKVLDAGNMTQASNYLLSKLAAGVNEEPHLVPSKLIGGDLRGGQENMLFEVDQRFGKWA